MGKTVEKAVNNIKEIISEALIWKDASNQAEIDSIMLSLDNTENKTNLGANAILAVSLACARAVSAALKMPLYRYIGGINAKTLPVPMLNILNGGAHASNNLDIQEFMIMPVGFETFKEAMLCSANIYNTLKEILKSKNLSTTVGDEGGFAPDLKGEYEAIELILKAIEKSGYTAGKDVLISLDAASSEWYSEEKGVYIMPKKNTIFTCDELMEYFSDLTKKYPILSIEDPFFEEDFSSFSKFTKANGKKLQIVGDDLFVTNKKRLLKGIQSNAANAILIKPNQIGSLSEVLETVEFAHKNNYNTIISHRSGETEDTFISDLAVGLNASQVKMGAPCRVDRTAKYNRLLKIEAELGDSAHYFGKNILK